MTDTETVLIATAGRYSTTAHLPATPDSAVPKCNHAHREGWRALPRDHPAVADKRLCKTCAGAVEQPSTHDMSTLQALLGGDES